MWQEPQLSLTRDEWRAVAIALRDAGDRRSYGRQGPLARLYGALTGNRPANRLADPRLEAIRSFVVQARRLGPSMAPISALRQIGLNRRQIEALALLCR
jgi:hypothetical protein